MGAYAPVLVYEDGYDMARSGVTFDGETDDTAAFRDCLNQVAFGAGVPPLKLLPRPGVMRLTDTVDIIRKAITMEGLGRGNPIDYVNPGKGTAIRWDGPAGIPVLRVRDVQAFTLSNMHLQGNDANPPSELIFFENTAADTVGTNQHILLDRILFGYLPWLPGSNGFAADYHVRFGGAVNANNDQFKLNNCQLMRPTIAGLKIDNTQSVWGEVENTIIDANGNGANGIDTAASIDAINLQFNGCAVDVIVQSTAQVDVQKWNSENARKLFNMVAGGGRLRVKGGLAILSQIVGGFFGTAGALAGGVIDLDGWTLSTGTASPRPQLQVVGASMSGAPVAETSIVKVTNCNTTAADYAISTLLNGRIKVSIHDMGIDDEVYLT